MNKLTYLIIHCTDTPKGRPVTSAEIRAWHTNPKPRGNGWHQVGYADMIHLSGSVENLVPYDEDDMVEPWEITNGAAGFNGLSRHVVYVGGKDSDNRYPLDTRTAQQRLMLANYVKQTIAQHPNIQVGGHNQFSNKYCPSFNVPEWLAGIGIPSKNIYHG